MILVAGMPYSGTTMLVDILESIGFVMAYSEYEDKNTGEDRLMAQLESDAWLAERDKRTEEHGDKWGYKDPFAFRKSVTGDRNILIFRDPIAMQRNQSFYELGLTISDFEKAYKWGVQNSALMLSYERMLIDPQSTIKRLLNFVETEVDRKKMDRLVQAIQPEKGHRENSNNG